MRRLHRNPGGAHAVAWGKTRPAGRRRYGRLHRNPGGAPAAAWGKTGPAGPRRHGRLHRNAGAALIVALSIMAVLLAVGLTFFAVTRIESTTAVNVVHTVRAQYLVDAGFAVAQHTLNRDLQVNPNATSTDHAWRTLFNGAAFIGKEWTWVDGIAPWDGGRTAFTLENVERALREDGLLSGGLLYAQFYQGDGDKPAPTPDGVREPLFRGPRTAPWLAVPRWSGQTILLYATAKNMRLTTAAGDRLTLTDVNNALTAAGRPERFERFDLAADTDGDGVPGDMDRRFPFVTPDFAGQVRVERPDGSTFLPFSPAGGEFFPANFVDLWADFDSDGDSLRDSVWIPLPKDADLSRDGVDNDLDGYADNQYLNPAVAAQGLAATDDGEIRRNFELGAFVYAVDPSGAVIRDQDPDYPTAVAGYRLTLPLPGLSVPVDMDRDGEITPNDRRPNAANVLEYVYLTLPGQLSVPGVPVSLTLRDVDNVDNDFDLTVNGFTAYAAPGPEFVTLKDDGTYDCPPTSVPALTDKGLRPLNLDVVAAAFALSNTALAAYHTIPVLRPDGSPTGLTCTCPAFVLGVSAESVCEVIGRMAVHIADESGKANLNNAGLHTYGHQAVLEASALTSVERAARVVRGMNQALSPVEYETRILPGDIGVQRTGEMWNMLMGAGVKVDSASNDNLWNFEAPVNPLGSVVVPQPYDYDVTLPGLGRADDNANSFLLAFSRRDENASGLPDSGLYLPRLSEWSKELLRNTPPPVGSRPVLWTDDVDGGGTAGYYSALGLLEGIDDPAEFLPRAPLRNCIAEIDGDDNNKNQTEDEIGELGDRTLAVHYELQKMAEPNGPTFKRIFGDERWPDINRFITAHSEARNVAYISTPYGDRAVNRLDPNYATAPQLAAALLLRGQFPNAATEITAPAPGFTPDAARFAFGLRQSNKTLRGALFGGNNAAPGLFPADAQLQALQTAVNVVDRRDRDAVRSLLVMEKRGSASLTNEPDEPPNERERVRQRDLFPAGAIQEYFSDSFGITPEFNDITAVDPWWASLTDPNISDPTDIGQQRLLSYAAAGAEAIRITEIMPRPVRRVEAEILPLNDKTPPPPPLSPEDQIHYQIDPGSQTPGTSANWTAANIPFFNLNPAPYTEMPVFDMDRVNVPEEQARLALPGPVFTSQWGVQSFYGMDNSTTPPRPLSPLGTANAWVYTPPAAPGWTGNVDDPANLGNEDVLEFRFRATNGLPPGRYYLTMNVQMPNDLGNGFMTVDGVVTLPGVGARAMLDYSVKYINDDGDPTTPEDLGQAADVARILALPDSYVDGGGNTVDLTVERFRLLQAYFRANFQTVDEAEFIANEAARLAGSGMPVGWVFAPARSRSDTVNAADYALITDYLEFILPASSAAFFDSFNTAYFLDSVIAGETVNTRTLTVIVPPVAGGAYNTLCVAVRMRPLAQNVLLLDPVTGAPVIDPNTGATIPRYLSVNFFDFSQEPDHEYVEVANTTDQELDLSGWTLEVGIPDPVGLDTNPEMRDPFKSVWEVPGGTRIAANGRLLLTFTDQQGAAKAPPLDTYRDTIPPDPDFAAPGANGIGMASLVGDPATDMVTVPPIADGSADAAYLDIQDADGTGSVFRRTATDHIDNDGDGVSSQNRYYDPASTIGLDTDGVLEEIRTHGNAAGVVPAFARIVPMVNRRLWEDAPYTDAAMPVSLPEINSVKRVAQLVLRGGVLPNYPERDGYDNDGDGGYTAKDSTAAYPSSNGAVLRRYIRGTLDKDMVDNDYNGLLDENGSEYFNGTVYEHANPFLSEGVDEGNAPLTYANQRPRVYGPGSFEAGTFPVSFVPYVTTYGQWLENYTGNADVQLGYQDTSFPTPPAISLPGVTPGDSPEWVSFVERRWNPGDNVIVTLYVGDSVFGRVADQATYREYDVINRAVDDIVESPYYVDGYSNYDLTGAWIGAGGTDEQNRVALGPDRLSYWPPDQMGLDFYRALERKHPLYAGDRFGTSNRWEPTDGAYDDWADSPGWYEQVYVPDGDVGRIEPRFGPDLIYTATPKEHVARLFGHAMAGSPLRMNLTERLWENPPDLVAGFFTPGSGPEDTAPMLAMRTWDADGTAANTPGKMRQFLENDEVVFPGEAGVYVNHAHAFRRAGPDNVPYATLADLMRVPMPLFEHSLNTDFRIPSAYVNTRYQPVNDTRLPHVPPGVVAGAVWRQDLSVRAAILANAAPLNPHQDPPMRARMAGLGDLTELSALDPIVLTVGQAGFAPLWPNPANDQAGLFGAAGSPEDLSLLYAQWQDVNSDGLPETAPFYWSPVYLFADGNAVAETYARFPVFGAVVSGATQYLGQGTQLTQPSSGWSWPVVLNRAFLADWNRLAPVFGTMVPNSANPETSDMTLVNQRWPVARRAALFVSKYDTAAGEENRPEAIFTWDADDGVVNGTYIVYVGTFVPGMADQLGRLQEVVTGLSADGAAALLGSAAAPVLTEPPLPMVTDGAGNLVLEPRLAGLLALDANRDLGTADRFDPLLALEFVTDRTTASRVAPPQPPSTETLTPEERERIRLGALPHPRDWYPPDPIVGSVPSGVAYRADGDGMILYSHDASMAWRPRLVRVTDNFLALRVRNLGRPDQVACITCVVLTPAPRTYGRLNVNTAETGQYEVGETNPVPYLFNPLLGLPGIVKAYDTMTGVAPTGAPRPLDDLDLPSRDYLKAQGVDLPPLGYTPNPALGNPLLHQLDPYPAVDGAWDAPHEGLASLRLLSLLVSQRPHHPDGRYFTALASLAAGAGEDGILGNESGVLPVRPLSNYRHAEPRFDEIYQRFSGMANLVETRSDMFEILVTVQEGNLSDLDGDGRLDYRGRMNSEEFVKTAESAGRAIYERRARKDASEEARGVR